MSSTTSYERLSGKDAVSERSASYPSDPPKRSTKTLLLWWLPEITASFSSVVTLISIVVVLRVYNGKPLTNLDLPKYLTLNGIIAALATLNSAFLVAPVGSAIMQEVWLLFAAEGQKAAPASQLHGLELFDSASRGAFGSFALIFHI